jgi:hypothetical protein
MARLVGVDLPREEAARDRAHLHLRDRAHPRPENPRRDRGQPTVRVTDRRRRAGQAPRLDRRQLQGPRVTSAVRSPQTSGARSRSAPTRESATVAASRCTASARTPTPARARARVAPSPARRSRARSERLARRRHLQGRVPGRPRACLVRPSGRLAVLDSTFRPARELLADASEEPPGRGRQEGAPQGEEERGPRPRAHQEHVQQHHRLDHRPHGQRDLVGERRHVGFKGSRKSTPFAA